MEPRTAVGYVRVSTQEQAGAGVSLDAQVARIGAYCTLQGLQLAEVLQEPAVSGTVPLGDRPAGAELQARLRAGARHVVAVKLDRLFRDAGDCLVVVRGWDRLGVSLHVCDLGGAAVDTSSAAGRFMLTVLAAVAEMERNQTAERTRAALAHLRDTGRVYGPVPIGYRREGDRLVVDGEGAAAVALAVALHGRGDSLRGIGAALRAAGYRSPKGAGTWRPGVVQQILRRAGCVTSRRAA